mmetsp:Transcript_30384/g.98123  ORF Transcript_30384/g.98123 Transcript_30384/m.98123 type:complete len:203 (+) Transcript_30384:523-1131(+)
MQARGRKENVMGPALLAAFPPVFLVVPRAGPLVDAPVRACFARLLLVHPLVDVGGQVRRQLEEAQAEVRPEHAAVERQLPHHPLDLVDLDREGDALQPEGLHAVHTDHLAVNVDQGATRVAGVDGGVGLDVDGGVAPVCRAAHAELRPRALDGRDDAQGDRIRQSSRRAHGHHEISRPELSGRTEPGGRQRAGRVDPHDGHV